MSISIQDKEKRHYLRGNKKSCKIKACKIRGRYNYGREYFYHGFCKKHYSQYQEGIIDFHGKRIRKYFIGKRNIEEFTTLRKKKKRWNKIDHLNNHLRCRIVGCERKGELSHGKIRYFKNMCSYHYRDWYLKGFMDKDANIILKSNKPNNVLFSTEFVVTAKMVKTIKKHLVDFNCNK